MSLYYALILYPCTISLCHILTPCPYVMSLCYDYIQCHCLFLSPPLFPYSLPSAPYVTEKKSHIIYSSLHSTHPSSLLMGGCVSGRGKEQPENEQTEAGRFGDFSEGQLSLSRNRGQSSGRLRAYTARSRWHMEEKSSRFLRNLPLFPCFVPGYGLETAPEGTMSQISPPPSVHFPDPPPRPRPLTPITHSHFPL